MTGLVGLSLLLPGHAAMEPHAWAILLVAAGMFALCLHPAGRAWWLRMGAAGSASPSTSTVLLAAAMAPLLYAPTGSAYTVDLAIDVTTWLVVALTARLLARQLLGATSELATSDQRFLLLANDVPAVVYHQTLVDDEPVAVLGIRVRRLGPCGRRAGPGRRPRTRPPKAGRVRRSVPPVRR